MSNPLLAETSDFLKNFTLSIEEKQPQYEIVQLPPSLLVQKMVTFCEVRYHLEGKYPPLEVLALKFDCPEKTVLQNIEEVSEILVRARFLPPVEFSVPEEEFDPDFLIASNMIIDALDKRSNAAKLKSIGKSTQWWNNQLKKDFQNSYHTTRVQETYGQIPNLAKTSLARLVEGGDLNALKYAEEKLNIYRPQQQAFLDFTKIISQFMEILVTYLSSEQIEEVANKLERVIDTNVKEIESGT